MDHPPPPPPSLDLIIRFSTSHPDLILPIASPSTTSALALKQQIRGRLSPDTASSGRLRLIHAGKVLPDTAGLSRSLNTASGPPPSKATTRDDEDDTKSAKSRGKLPARETVSKAAAAAVRVYIHCSIGDALTSSELSTEAQKAREADEALQAASASPSVRSNDEPARGQGDAPTITTTPAPRGFDRLLTAGFTPAEVAALRTQFLAIQAHTHTPDTMPSGPELLALEEQWLDNGSDAPGAGGAGDDMAAGGFGSEDAGGLEDMLYGNLIGFFWPVGAVCWLMREEGVWTRRRQIAVLSGFLVNLTFGFLRVMS